MNQSHELVHSFAEQGEEGGVSEKELGRGREGWRIEGGTWFTPAVR